MLTDAPPRRKNLKLFNDSDRLNTILLPRDGSLPKIAAAMDAAMKAEATGDVRRACEEFLQTACYFYRIPRVRSACSPRNHSTFASTPRPSFSATIIPRRTRSASGCEPPFARTSPRSARFSAPSATSFAIISTSTSSLSATPGAHAASINGQPCSTITRKVLRRGNSSGHLFLGSAGISTGRARSGSLLTPER